MRMGSRYLVDASALYPLILKLQERIILEKDRFSILDLTVYEVGNVLWKEYKRGKIKDLESVVRLFRKVLNELPKLSIKDLGEVLKIAVEDDLTFYDAAYIHLSKVNNLELVTEDQDILSKYSKAIRTSQLKIQ